jgi:hypothetical protein
MKITHVLGHNSNWNIDAYFDQNIGDNFLITAYSHGKDFLQKKSFQRILNNSMLDLQFYGNKHSKGKLSEFDFHPSNHLESEITNVYFENCIKSAIEFQKNNGFKNIIIPHLYTNEDVEGIIKTIKNINRYILKKGRGTEKYFMTLPFANHIIIDKDKIEDILSECTTFDICFDGYFIVCENKPEFRKKITIDLKILKNITRILTTLKRNNFQTIYAYANWDALLHLTKTEIDYITIGTYENLRNFDIKRFTEDESGGASKGYYFSEKLLNMVRADSITLLRETNSLNLIKNERNIFSDIILREGFNWNIHKPEVNKNYLLSITRLLKDISMIDDVKLRKKYVINLVDSALEKYDLLEEHGVFLDREGMNYHLNTWKTYLSMM